MPVPTPDSSQPLEGHDAGNLPFTLHQLLAFKTVVSYGRQQTADMLGVTATNISLMLNKLEKDFDEQLLIRSKRAPLQRTPAGQLLLRYTDRMLGLCNDALTAAKDLQTVRTGTMVVGASQTTGIYLMPQLLGDFLLTNTHALTTDVPMLQTSFCSAHTQTHFGCFYACWQGWQCTIPATRFIYRCVVLLCL